MSVTHKSIPPTRLTPSPIFQIHISYLLGSATQMSNTQTVYDLCVFPNPEPSTWNALLLPTPPPANSYSSFKTQLGCLRVQKVLPGTRPSWAGCASNSTHPKLHSAASPLILLLPHYSPTLVLDPTIILFSVNLQFLPPLPPKHFFTLRPSSPLAGPHHLWPTASVELLPICCHLVVRGIRHTCQRHSPM